MGSRPVESICSPQYPMKNVVDLVITKNKPLSLFTFNRPHSEVVQAPMTDEKVVRG